MKIGIDIDNTITDTIPVLKEYAKKYNFQINKEYLIINNEGFNTSNICDWTKEEQKEFCDRYLEETVMSVKVRLNASDVIEKLKKENNYIYIITSRSNECFKNPFELTEKFLKENNIVYDELIVGCKDKYKFCFEHNIDIMIDDEPQNIKEISKIIPIIVFNGEQNKNCEGKNIIKVNNWEEVYKKIKEL